MKSEILIIGGGIMGLATAIELKMRGCNVTVISRDFQAAATFAAAGMLAPEAEQVQGAMRELCVRSRSLYPEWTSKLEQITGLNPGYWACGILSPVYQVRQEQGENISSCPLPNWLDKQTIHQYQSGLGEDVIGGFWYPDDAQVDNRALAQTLLSAAQSLGVEIRENILVEGIQQQQGQVIGLQTNIGIMRAEHYVLATGAWSDELLPLSVRPCKGQMLSLVVPDYLPKLPLNRILFGEEIYIVPRQVRGVSPNNTQKEPRKIIIGASVEDVGFTPNNTAIGIANLLQKAIRLFPEIRDYAIAQMWWGYRPTTPDELPILGESPLKNLTFATGHHRNGILLAPITSVLIADLITGQKKDPLLANFHYSRFQSQNQSSTPTPMFTNSTNLTNLSNGNGKGITVQTPNTPTAQSPIGDSPLIIAGKTFKSRLMTGTGKYRSMAEMQQSVISSGCEIVTVAVRRVQTNAPGHEGLAEALDWSKIWMLPNTAGCKTAEEAIRVARLGREMAKLLGQEDNNFIKLEVIPDAKYLLPDPIGTLQAAEQLVKEGFAVLPYINADPMLARHLEDAGCVTVMPLASPIGSGQGLKTTANIQIIIENAKIPVVVDAGIGAPSEAAQAMEMGADALLINSAIALAQNPAAMAYAMNLAAVAGRTAYLAGRMPMKDYAIASSPLTGTVN
ncbi:glycine oxidase ThiO [Calothrix sp. UHCC 0171]|uniref:glycine oxidase ThiO n=1 Tax=Calothrix sp. UHCC 0171 TaxID=3110245 RepID=UPI002B2197CA|nr:glycine oxidase ThiO [Calothrix sp. UHCC 0171]MEA5570435.1 glycine oxidase ThiO [Calothrix sp. UHCC 0171]